MSREAKILMAAMAVAIALLMWRLDQAEAEVAASEIVRADTICIVSRDTIIIKEPRIVERVAVRIIRDTLLLADTGEPAAVDVPIEKAHYADSLCEAWVSGYKPRLDSIRIYREQRTAVVTNFRKPPPSKWSAGLQGGIGITPKGIQPYVGVGIAYKIDF